MVAVILKSKIVALFILFLLFNILVSNGQSQIFLKGKYTERGVELRWAPNDFVAWTNANLIGYNIYKVNVSKDGKGISPLKKIKINKQVIKPYTEVEWERALGSSPTVYQLTAMQGFFGEGMTSFQGQGIGQMISQNKQNQDRFGFTLFAADVDKTAAKALGLLFTDDAVQPNMEVYYEVRLANQDTLSLKPGITIVETFKPLRLPVIQNFKTEAADHLIALKWPIWNLKTIYAIYEIQKSEVKEGPFTPFKGPAILPTTEKEFEKRTMMIVDTLDQNNKSYYYRIRGKDFFGDWGPFSKVVSGAGLNLFTNQAILSLEKAVVVKNKEVHIEWTMNEIDRVVSYRVLRGTKPTGSFKIIKNKQAPKALETFVDQSPIANGYYKIEAYDAKDRTVQSNARFAPLIDETPPEVPEFVSYEIDTIGNVNLVWKKSKAVDFKDFRLFRKFRLDEEFIELVPAHLTDTSYVDRLNLKANPKNVFYYLIAIDQRYNQSDDSKVIKIKVPDKIAPTLPFVSRVEQVDSLVVIDLVLPEDQDLHSLKVFRSPQNAISKSLIANRLIVQEELEMGIIQIVDSTILQSGYQNYYIVAVDSSGNESNHRVTGLFFKRTKEAVPEYSFSVSQVKRAKHVSISWTSIEEVKAIKIYKRKIGNKSWTLIHEEFKDRNSYLDVFVSKGIIYEYQIKVEMENTASLSTIKRIKI